MTLWHRLIGRIVKDGVAAGTLDAEHRSVRARRRCSPRRSKAASCSPASTTIPRYIDRVVDAPGRARRDAARRSRRRQHDGSRPRFRSRPKACAAARSRWTDPARARFQRPRPQRLRASRRDAARRAARRRPRPRCSACSSTTVERGRTVFSMSPTRCTRTRWERCTAASSRRSSTPRWVARSRRCFRPTPASRRSS